MIWANFWRLPNIITGMQLEINELRIMINNLTDQVNASKVQQDNDHERVALVIDHIMSVNP